MTAAVYNGVLDAAPGTDPDSLIPVVQPLSPLIDEMDDLMFSVIAWGLPRCPDYVAEVTDAVLDISP